MANVTTPQPTPTAEPSGTLLLSALVRHTALDAAGQEIGRLSDVIVRLHDDHYPAVTGLVAHIGGRELFVPAAEILAWDSQRLELVSPRLDLRPFERRTGEVLLRGDVLGHRLVDVEQSRMVTAHDVQLSRIGDGWVATAVDIHPRALLRRRNEHTWRDWSSVEALIGHDISLPARSRMGGLRRLKPAQLADLIEEASEREQHELLSRVHAHPDLEADVKSSTRTKPAICSKPAPTPRSPMCCPICAPTTLPTRFSTCPRSDARACSTSCPSSSGTRSPSCSATRRPRPGAS